MWEYVLIFLGVELLDPMVTLFNLLEVPDFSPMGVHHFHTPAAVHKSSNFSTSSSMLVFVCVFYQSCPSGYEVASRCGFHFHFLDS